jgi:hypothetical protein
VRQLTACRRYTTKWQAECQLFLSDYNQIIIFIFSGDFILKINAVDPDSGPNGELQYRLLPGPDSHLFDLGLRSGALSLATDDLGGGKTTFTLPFEVSDLGTPQLSAKSMLRLSPADRALFPVFSSLSGTISLRENDLAATAEGGAAGLPKFEANGLDQKEVNYQLAAGNWEDSFAVEEKSGRLRLLKGLDHEKVRWTIYLTVLKGQCHEIFQWFCICFLDKS